MKILTFQSPLIAKLWNISFANHKIFLLGAWLEFQNLYYLKQYRYVIHWRNISWWSQMKMMIIKNDCSFHKNENRYIQFCFDTIFFSCAVIKYPLNIRYISIHYQVFVKCIVQKYISYQEMYCNRCLKSKISFFEMFWYQETWLYKNNTKINHRMKTIIFV